MFVCVCLFDRLIYSMIHALIRAVGMKYLAYHCNLFVVWTLVLSSSLLFSLCSFHCFPSKAKFLNDLETHRCLKAKMYHDFHSIFFGEKKNLLVQVNKYVLQYSINQKNQSTNHIMFITGKMVTIKAIFCSRKIVGLAELEK